MKKIMAVTVLISFFISTLPFPVLKVWAQMPLPHGQESLISLDFKDVSLKDVLKLFSIQSGLNFIASEAVQDRKLTLYLDKVPLKEVMDRLFIANNLEYKLDKDANVFIVKDLGKPSPEIVTKVFYLKYATVSSSHLPEEFSSNIAGVTSGTGSSSSGGGGSRYGVAENIGITKAVERQLSEYGNVIEDYRTNSLIVSDVPTRMPRIAETIAALDVSVPQILIEVEMLDVSKNVVDKIGFKFGQTPLTLVLTGATTSMGFPFDAWGKMFADDTVRGTLGINSGSNSFTEQLDFLRTQTDTKILARPRILTLNNETAEIKITTQETIGTLNTTSTGGGQTPVTTISTERAETGVRLRVTPQVNPDTGEITMFIMPSVKDTATSLLPGVTAKDPEERSTRSIVRLKDGETVVIGGLIRHQFTETITKWPLFGDLPLLGRFFRHKDTSPNKERELLVFITPRIIKDADVRLAQAKKVQLPVREQSVVSGVGREQEVSSSLDSFERKKK